MYFDPLPKTERKDLFGVDYAISNLINAFTDPLTRMIVIKGLRRTGKTSLLNVALKESRMDYVKLDVRESPYLDKIGFMKFLVEKIRGKIEEPLLQKIVKSIAGLGLGYKDVSIELLFSKEDISGIFFEKLDYELNQKKKKLILAFDEIQLLKEIKFDFLLASIFDNYKNIKLVLTGSEMGLIDKFLGKKDYDAPLFGRAYLEIDSKRLKEEESAAFIQEGMKQLNKSLSFEELQEIIENLDGVIGWLTQYGWLRYKGLSHKSALSKTKEEGKEIVRRELNSFLQSRKAKEKYLQVLKIVAKGNETWNAIKLAMRKEKAKFSDSQLNSYLIELIDYGFLEKTEGKYYLSDPITLSAVR